MTIQLFDEICVYNKLKDETIIYGQYNINFDSIFINIQHELVFSNYYYNLDFHLTHFYIKLKGKICELENIIFFEKSNKQLELNNIHLKFPFEDCKLNLNSNSAVIITICKDYSHRLDEWIQYNLKLGFSGIIIFDNDGNKSNNINESLNFCTNNSTTKDICKKYKDRVYVVNTPYTPFIHQHWNNIQLITLTIGVNEFRNKCRHIALIDADEFIYIPEKIKINI